MGNMHGRTEGTASGKALLIGSHLVKHAIVSALNFVSLDCIYKFMIRTNWC